jgi:hypothetical protein
MFYAFFWGIPLRLNFICRRFGTLYLFHLYMPIKIFFLVYLFNNRNTMYSTSSCAGKFPACGLYDVMSFPLARRSLTTDYK